jgi:hypothetical protein
MGLFREKFAGARYGDVPIAPLTSRVSRSTIAFASRASRARPASLAHARAEVLPAHDLLNNAAGAARAAIASAAARP